MNKRGINKYEQMGLAATLPGMINAVEVLQGEIDRMRAVLGYAQERGAAPDENEGQELTGQKAYWAKMTPEQRKSEMARRGMMGRAKRAAKKRAAKKNGAASDEVDIDRLHPRDPRSPRHDAYIRKLRKSQKAYWATVPAGKRDRAANLAAGGTEQ
jgi:hypothetical protein